MNTAGWRGFWIVWACGGALACAAGPEAVVKGDHVNLRARPAKNAEVVAQVDTGTRLAVREVTNGWVMVAAPAAADLWVHREFVKDGKAVSRLNVRAGAGINYPSIVTLNKGDALQVRGEFGEWIKIAPPAAAALWVSQDLVDVVQPAPPVVVQPPVARPPVTPPTPPPAAVPPPPPPYASGTTPAPAPAALYVPQDVTLAPVNNQGRAVVREGRLRTMLFAFNRPSRFHLAREQGNQQETICYLRGNEAQLRTLEEKRLRIRGREYFVQGVRYPMVVVDEITVLSEQP